MLNLCKLCKCRQLNKVTIRRSFSSSFFFVRSCFSPFIRAFDYSFFFLGLFVIGSFGRSFRCSSIRPSVHSSFRHSFVLPFVPLFVLFVCSFVPSFFFFLVRELIRSFVCAFCSSLGRVPARAFNNSFVFPLLNRQFIV